MTRTELINAIKKELYSMAYDQERYSRLPSVLERFCTYSEDGDGAYEKDSSAIGFGLLQEVPEGEDYPLDSIDEGYMIVGKFRTFAKRAWFTKEAVKDDQHGVVAKAISNGLIWMDTYMRSKNAFASKILNYGAFTAGHDVYNNTVEQIVTDSSGDFIYDGKPLFAASGNNHPLKKNDAATKYNSLGATALSAANFKTALTLLTQTNAVDERGDMISIIPDTLMVASKELELAAYEILTSTYKANLASTDAGVNTDNVLRNFNIDIVYNPDMYAINPSGWVLFDSKMPGIVFKVRQKPEFNVWIDKNNGKLYVAMDARWGCWVRNWRPFVASNFATA